MYIRSKYYNHRSYRLRGYDYRSPGRYFLTLNVKHRLHSFGHIENGEMHLSVVGMIAHQYIEDIPIHYRQVSLGAFVVMPDHIHLILIINELESTNNSQDTDSPVEKIRKFGKPIPGSVSMIINQYKSSVKRWCNKNNHSEFQWQSRFYDHIIRSDRSFFFISRYIVNNPKNWVQY
jgi:putative transposase